MFHEHPCSIIYFYHRSSNIHKTLSHIAYNTTQFDLTASVLNITRGPNIYLEYCKWYHNRPTVHQPSVFSFFALTGMLLSHLLTHSSTVFRIRNQYNCTQVIIIHFQHHICASILPARNTTKTNRHRPFNTKISDGLIR